MNVSIPQQVLVLLAQGHCGTTPALAKTLGVTAYRTEGAIQQLRAAGHLVSVPVTYMLTPTGLERSKRKNITAKERKKLRAQQERAKVRAAKFAAEVARVEEYAKQKAEAKAAREAEKVARKLVERDEREAARRAAKVPAPRVDLADIIGKPVRPRVVFSEILGIPEEADDEEPLHNVDTHAMVENTIRTVPSSVFGLGAM